jgi:hypothetical protein
VRALEPVGYQVGLNWKLLDPGMTVAPFDQENIVFSDTHIFNPSLYQRASPGV